MRARRQEKNVNKPPRWLLLLLTAFLLAAAGCIAPGPPPNEQPPPPAVAPTQPPPAPTAPPEDDESPDAPGLPVPPLVLNGSQPQGTDAVVGELIYDPDFLLRIDARRVDGPDEPGAGIAAVEFRISTAAGQEVFAYTDNTTGYCVFGGGEPACHSWPLVDGVFRWGEGGPPIEPGQYNGLAIFHFAPYDGDGDGSAAEESWRFSFEIAAP